MAIIFAIIVTVIVAFCCYGSMKPVRKASNASGYITQALQLTFEKEDKVGMLKVSKVRNEIKEMNKR